MLLIVAVLLSLASHLALGSPFIFPHEVNVDSDGVWTIKFMESKLGVNDSSLGIMNTSAKVEKVFLPGENVYHWANNTSEIGSEMSDQGEDYLGNKRRNETYLLPLVANIGPDFLNDGSFKRSSDDSPMRKSMDTKLEPALDVPSEYGAEITLFKNVKRRSSGNQIFFPNTRIPVNSNPIQGSGNSPNSPMIGPCRDGYIRYQGECSQLLSSKSCGENWWLVMKGHDFANCESRPCLLGQIFYQNICVDPEDSTICAQGQMIYVDLTGEAFCDCESDYFYYEFDGTCVPEYTQGWCNWGEYIVQNGDEIPECVTNPCGIDGSVYHEINKMCYKKTYVGFCEQKHIEINETEAGCKDIALRNIFEVPTLRRCPRGSLRDIRHECRRRFNVPSIPSVLKSNHLRGRCPTGWTKGPRGRCKKIVNLFGK